MRNYHFTVQWITDNGSLYTPAKSRRVDVYENDGVTLRGYFVADGTSNMLNLMNNALQKDTQSSYDAKIANLPANTNNELATIKAGGLDNDSLPESALTPAARAKLNNASTRLPIALTDGFNVTNGSEHQDNLIYAGSGDITIELGSPASSRVVDIYNLSSTGSITINSVISNTSNTVLPASQTSRHVKLYYSGIAWFAISDEDNLVGVAGVSAEFDSAYIEDATSNKLRVKFTADVSGVRAQDFLLFDTHVRIIDERHPDWNASLHTPTKSLVTGGYEVVFSLDDYVLAGADEAPSVYYFSKSGTLRDANNNNKVLSFEQVVTNNATAYNGSKTLQKIASGGSVSGAVAADTIVALQRGGTYTETSVGASDGVVFTAYGTGAKPVLDMSTGFTFNSIENVRFANLDVSSDDHGIRAAGPCHFMFVNSCNFTYTGTGNNDSGIITYTGTGASNVIAEGQTVINSTVSNYANGISSKLNYQGVLTWDNRVIGGTGTPYRYEKNVIDCQTISGMPEGDGIAMARGRYQNSVIRNNEIKGWADDGIDLYGARLVIAEYNYIHNENVNVENGGRGIKCGGEGGGGGEDDRSGSNIIRYNVISKMVADLAGGGTSSSCNAIDTNNMNGIGDDADLNSKTLIYGNVVYGVPQHALQFTGSDGTEFEIYNNLFIGGAGGNGINFFNATNTGSLYVRNCIINTTNGNFDGNYNIFTGSIGSYVTGSNDQTGVLLSAIFTDTVDIRNASIQPGSPTINAGLSIGNYTSDANGVEIDQGNQIDIGPIEHIAV